MPSDPTPLLRAAHAQPDLDDGAMRSHRERLEPELLARFERTVRADRSSRPGRGWLRLGLGLAFGSCVAAAACAWPTEYDLGLVQRLSVTLPPGSDPDAIVRFVHRTFEAEEIGARVHEQRSDDGTASLTLQLDVVARDLQAEDLCAAVAEELGPGPEPVCETREGTVRGTLGGKLTGGWLDEVIARHGVEEAKRQLLERLEAEGMQGDAEVEVFDTVEPDGRRRREIRVRVEAEHSVP